VGKFSYEISIHNVASNMTTQFYHCSLKRANKHRYVPIKTLLPYTGLQTSLNLKESGNIIPINSDSQSNGAVPYLGSRYTENRRRDRFIPQATVDCPFA
jgi:hypothetical protein